MKTLANKIWAIAFMVLGYLTTLPEGDGTVFIFLLIPSIYLFFAKKNCINL